MGSRVPPAVTTIVRPARVRAWAECPPAVSRANACRAIDTGSARRPSPLSPEPSAPVSGSITCTPRRRNVATLACVALASHMFECMAGATTTGAALARTVSDTMSSAKPAASLASVLAVAGTTMIRSATRASSTCSARPSPAMSTATGREVMPSHVERPTKSRDARVAATRTSWPAR